MKSPVLPPSSQSSDACIASEESLFRFDLDWDSNGAICRYPSDDPQWRIASDRNPWGVLACRAFRLLDAQNTELIRIHRTRRFPFSIFTIYEGRAPIGTISLKSLLLNRYEINLIGQPIWTFHWRLYSTRCSAVSSDNVEVQVIKQAHTAWLVWLPKECESVPLLAALSFLHRRVMNS